jgi:hypothetical protein
MVIGVGAVVIALVGVGIAVKFATDAPPKPDLSKIEATARPKNDIPPPPEATSTGPLSQDIPVMKPGSLPKAGDPTNPSTADTNTTAPSQPAAQPVAAPPPPKPQPIAAAPVAAPPPRANTGAQAAPQPPQPPKPPKPPKGGSGGGIVRDSPF